MVPIHRLPSVSSSMTSHRAGKAVLGDVVDEAPVLEAAEASIGSNPDASVAIVGQRLET